jgi:hypothetical protein
VEKGIDPGGEGHTITAFRDRPFHRLTDAPDGRGDKLRPRKEGSAKALPTTGVKSEDHLIWGQQPAVHSVDP